MLKTHANHKTHTNCTTTHTLKGAIQRLHLSLQEPKQRLNNLNKVENKHGKSSGHIIIFLSTCTLTPVHTVPECYPIVLSPNHSNNIWGAASKEKKAKEMTIHEKIKKNKRKGSSSKIQKRDINKKGVI